MSVVKEIGVGGAPTGINDPANYITGQVLYVDGGFKME